MNVILLKSIHCIVEKRKKGKEKQRKPEPQYKRKKSEREGKGRGIHYKVHLLKRCIIWLEIEYNDKRWDLYNRLKKLIELDLFILNRIFFHNVLKKVSQNLMTTGNRSLVILNLIVWNKCWPCMKIDSMSFKWSGTNLLNGPLQV